MADNNDKNTQPFEAPPQMPEQMPQGDPAQQGMPQAMPQGMDQGMPQAMPGGMPPQGMPMGMPPQQPSLEDQNGQGTPLIDGVTGSGIDPNTNQPYSNEGIDSMSLARDAFSRAFQDSQGAEMPPGQQMPMSSPDAGSMPPMQANQQTPPVPPQQMPMGQQMGTGIDVNAPITPDSPVPNQADIQRMVTEAVNNAVANGQLPDLSANDFAANSNYGIGDPTQTNLLEGIDGNVPSTPEGMEIDTVVNTGIPDIESDEFYEQFTDNPGMAIMDIANAIAAEKIGELIHQIQPLIDESNKVQFRNRVQDAIKSFTADGHEDFSNYRDDMVAYLNEKDLPMDDPASYERAYNNAKISALERMNQQLTETQGRTLADYMSDDSSFNEITSNSKVKERIISDYLNELSNGASPQVISSSSGNAPDATEPKKASSIKEAGKMFFNRMKG